MASPGIVAQRRGAALVHLLTPADAQRGGRARAHKAKLAKTVRVVAPDAVPPLATLDDAVSASAWLFRMAASGALDPATTRECNRSISSFVNATHKADLLKRIRALEQLVTQFEQERRA